MSAKILRFPDGQPEPETPGRARLSVSLAHDVREALSLDRQQRPQLVTAMLRSSDITVPGGQSCEPEPLPPSRERTE